VRQLDDNISALGNLSLSTEELTEIDHLAIGDYALDSEVNLWKTSSDQ
jgi:hypothetical protein